jgi:dienelactone hydrolase
MRKISWRIMAIATAGLLLGGLIGNTAGRYFGWTVSRTDPGELSSSLRQYYRVSKPAGPGPFPTGLLFSGCDGPKDNMDRWAKMLNDNGWAAIIVDSHSPRNYQDFEVWRLICTGQLLFGTERAGDVLIAISDARRASFVDKDAIVLIGASHGGWAVMELLALERDWKLPPNLSRMPDQIPLDDPLGSVLGQILLYPYCGLANHASQGGWRHPAPTLFLLSGADSITPSEECMAVAELLGERGLPVETVVIPGVTHGFDQSERSSLSPLQFDAEATKKALELGSDFLASLRPTSSSNER